MSGRNLALYEWFTEIGWLIGLVLGTVVSFLGFDPKVTLFMCSGLNFLAFTLSLFLVADPLLIFEGGLVHIEKSIDFTFKGAIIASKALQGFPVHENLAGENIFAFCGGLVLFSLATSTLFTPLPIFFSNNLHLATGMVFAVYVLNSGAGMVGYFLAGNKLEQKDEKTRLQKVVLFRSSLVCLLAVLAAVGFHIHVLATLILILMGFAYALYHVYVLSLSMELIPAGKAGLFDALVGLGGAGGAFL